LSASGGERDGVSAEAGSGHEHHTEKGGETMNKPSDIEQLDCLTEGELGPLVECDRALQGGWARREAARARVSALNKQIAESVDLDVSAYRGEVATQVDALATVPVEIGALTRRFVLLHLAALKLQRDRKCVEVARLESELGAIQDKIKALVKEERALAVLPQRTPEERDGVRAALHECKAPESEALRAYRQARGLAVACDSTAGDYGQLGGGRYPGEAGRDIPVSLDTPASWGPAAHAQGEMAQKLAARG
jgi:hypothetical protein